MRPLLQYIRTLFTGWQGIISSTASIVFLIAAFIWKWAEQGQLRYWLIAAFGSYALASYRAWHENRPDLQIEVRSVRAHEAIRSGTRERSTIDIGFVLNLINTDKKENSIKEFELAVHLKDGSIVREKPDPTRGVSITVGDRGETAHVSVLKQGYLNTGTVNFRITNADLDFDIQDLDYDLRVTDVYGVTTTLKGKLPQMISVS